MRILLIEDSCDDAELLCLALAAEGVACELQRVESHAELQQALEGPPPDVVICDGHLPGFNGIEALGWVREHWPDVPFLFCLGSMESPESQAMAEAGDGCIGKHQLEQLPALLRRLAAG